MAAHARLRAELAAQLAETRARPLRLAAAAEGAPCRRVHDFYSPMGWHLGYVGMTEALWVLERARSREALPHSTVNRAERPGAIERPELSQR